MTTTPITITLTEEIHEALLTAAWMLEDVLSMLDLEAIPHAGESIGDVRDLLIMISVGNLETIGG